MNKRLAVLIVVIIIAIGSGFVYLLTGTKPVAEHVQTMQPDTTQQDPEPAQSATPETPQPGAYKDYSADQVASTKGTKILFFHAPWCPQCRSLEASIQAGPIPNDVTIFKVDYDSSQALKQKYEVTLQTTLVKIDDNGNLIKKFVAYYDHTLTALVRELL